MERFVWTVLAMVAISLMSGCAKNDTVPPASSAVVSGPPPEPTDAAGTLHEKLHAGAYQFDAALDSLQTAREALQAIVDDQGGDTKEALLDILDMLDSTGDTLGEYNVSPELDEVKKDVAASEKHLKTAIDDANDALRELRDAHGNLGDMLASDPPAKEKTALEKADGAIAEAIDAISDGIHLLGGEVLPESE